ncbi:MAG TPA: hypothetical protein VHD62_10225 [Opitutaceae bacterium]|nr:hypothetical protein [Opitutaceae bacterium]
MRLLPTGTNLSHMDFRVDGNAKNSIEFCDPLNPQFIPVVAVRSPVAMTVTTGQPAVAGRETHGVLTLRTASGKPIAPEDLLVAHTKKLHLMIVDPSVTDYQHVHPEPTRTPGEWAFSFSPRRSGTYRLFADFTPAATARGLYASVDLAVGAGDKEAPVSAAASSTDAPRPYNFQLTPGALRIRAQQPADLKFTVTRDDGGAVPLEPVMGAFAHLVAFDEARSGFAHLHPMEIDLAKPPDAIHPVLNFKVTIPRAGRYVIWAQVNLAGREAFVPFWFDVK